jgi:heptosyltransferase II
MKKLLFIKMGAMGDVFQAAAAMTYYRELEPEMRVEWVISDHLAPLLESMRITDQIHPIDERRLFSGHLLKRVTYLICLAWKLRGRFDRVIVGYQDRRYGLLASFILRKETRYFQPHAERPSPIHHRNRVYEYLRLLTDESHRGIDINAAMKCLTNNRVEPFPDRLALMRSFRKGFIVLVPGGARNSLRSDDLRRWPLSHYRDLAERLLKAGFDVVLAGGPNDLWVIPEFAGLRVTNMIGETNLVELWGILAQALAVVSHDTGPLHMAISTDTAVVALIGPTPSNAVVPMGRPRTTVLDAGNRTPCSPCYDGKNYAACQQPICMAGLTVDEVMLALTKYVAEPVGR